MPGLTPPWTRRGAMGRRMVEPEKRAESIVSNMAIWYSDDPQAWIMAIAAAIREAVAEAEAEGSSACQEWNARCRRLDEALEEIMEVDSDDQYTAGEQAWQIAKDALTSLRFGRRQE